MQIHRIILASTSPYRKALLETTGLHFECMGSEVDESALIAEGPLEVARLRAQAKAQVVAERFPEALVIGCDQVMEFSGKALDKVYSEEEARERLSALSGHSHELHSAFSLYQGERCLHDEVVSVSLQMRKLLSDEINSYIATGEWQGCVGCYQFENRGGLLFEVHHGYQDASAIVGLPLRELNHALMKLGIHVLTHPQGPWVLRG